MLFRNFFPIRGLRVHCIKSQFPLRAVLRDFLIFKEIHIQIRRRHCDFRKIIVFPRKHPAVLILRPYVHDIVHRCQLITPVRNHTPRLHSCTAVKGMGPLIALEGIGGREGKIPVILSGLLCFLVGIQPSGIAVFIISVIIIFMDRNRVSNVFPLIIFAFPFRVSGL